MTQPADLLIFSRIITLDDAQPNATALAVRDGHIVWVGDAREADVLRGRATRVRRWPKATVMPGWQDAHGHLLSLGRALTTLDVRGATDEQDAAQRVGEAAKGTPSGWIQGRGWDQNEWPGKAFPTAAALDGTCPTHPVVLTRVDGHAIWANSKAMAIAGISAETPDPDGGRIERTADGQPTGVFVDNAMDLVLRHIPPLSAARRRAYLEAAFSHLAAAGITGVHDAGVDGETLTVLRDMGAAGQLPIRVYAMLHIEEWMETNRPLPEPVQDAYHAMFSARAVKIFADGALGSRGAWLSEHYEDDPTNKGLALRTNEELREWSQRAHAKGFQVAIHAIGDAAATAAIDAVAPWASKDNRPRLEHAQIVRPVDQARMATLGIIASMQPVHCTSDMGWAEARLGAQRVRWAYAWRSMQRAGVPLAFGSDFPVEPADPRLGLHAARTRQTGDGHPGGGWQPQERLHWKDALRGFTHGAAYAAFSEHRLGTLSPGMMADMTVVGEPLDGDGEGILNAPVLATFVGGRLTYAAGKK